MHYLYGSRPQGELKLVATFDSEPQLLAYLRWATLHTNADGTRKFEQGSPLVGFPQAEASAIPLTDEAPEQVPHNPTPSML